MLPKQLLVGLIALTCVSCLTPREGMNRQQRKALEKIDIEACRQKGGEIQDVCMAQMPACVAPYPDAGTPCRDSSECGGQCRYEGEEGDNGAEVQGECQENDDPCGCFAEVVDGRLTPALCVD